MLWGRMCGCSSRGWRRFGTGRGTLPQRLGLGASRLTWPAVRGRGQVHVQPELLPAAGRAVRWVVRAVSSRAWHLRQRHDVLAEPRVRAAHAASSSEHRARVLVRSRLSAPDDASGCERRGAARGRRCAVQVQSAGEPLGVCAGGGAAGVCSDAHGHRDALGGRAT
eukprot:3584255-Rhodomonas_salina.2